MPLFDAAAFSAALISPFRVLMIFCFCRCAAADITRRMIAFSFRLLSFSFAAYADISRYAISTPPMPPSLYFHFAAITPLRHFYFHAPPYAAAIELLISLMPPPPCH
jgi:hypothetical protein